MDAHGCAVVIEMALIRDIGKREWLHASMLQIDWHGLIYTQFLLRWFRYSV